MGAAAVARNANREFLWTIAQPITHGDFFFAEYWACKLGLQIVALKGFAKVLLEVDSQSLQPCNWYGQTGTTHGFSDN